jgi:uroporphyrinogen-III synthase
MNSSSSPGSPRLRVCAFESRLEQEMRGLLERQGFVATVAPSMREVPLDRNPQALEFAAELFAGNIDLVILLTGVGARTLRQVVETRYDAEEFLAALRKCGLVARGPKPAAVLREWQMTGVRQVPEPNTWHEILTLLDRELPVAGKRVALQEQGQPNPEFVAALEQRGAQVVPVPVYRWELPEETGPLEEAVRQTITGGFDVLTFTSAQQLQHVLQIADRLGLRQEWLAAARRCVVASVGPTATEALVAAGLTVDLQPPHPKMGHLVQALVQGAAAALAAKP